MKNLSRIALLFLSVLCMSNCGNEDDTLSGDIYFDFSFSVGDSPFQYGEIFQIGDTKVSFSFVKFYMHDITFHEESGAVIKIDDTYVLAGPGESFEFAKVEKSHYHRILFNLGVAPQDNDQSENDFTVRAPDDPLAMQSPERMHWNWNSGYFL